MTGVALCSTVPAALHEMRLMCTRYYSDVPVVVVEPGVRTGVPILTDNPKEVGSDRIINALAAATQFGGPAIVVDFGTATTFDAVSAKGELFGRRYRDLRTHRRMVSPACPTLDSHVRLAWSVPAR